MNFEAIDDMEISLQRKGIGDAIWGEDGWGHTSTALDVEAVRTTATALSPEQAYAKTIAVNSAVSAIARNLSKAKLRLFTKSGREITGGPLYDLFKHPVPGMSTRRWLLEIVSWYNIRGEFDCLKGLKDGRPEFLLPLSPQALDTVSPTMPRSRQQVTRWRYNYPDGAWVEFGGYELLSETMFNPLSAVRGLPPTEVGALQIGTDFHANRYNRSFFENDATPSYVFVLPEGTARKDRDIFKRELLQRHGTFGGHAHTAAVVSGKDVHIEKINDRQQDGSFNETLRQMHADVAMLYHVPAIEMGIYDKSRFDTAAEERKLFVESTLAPEADAISEALQHQVVDMFPGWTFTTEAPRRMSKAFTESYEKAMDERDNSSVIVLLDLDTLPIMAAVKASMISTAKEFRNTLNLSAQETIDYFKLDIESRPEREDVWVDQNLRNITHPEMNATLNPQKPEPGADKKPEAKPETKPAKKEANPDERRVLLALRKLTLSKMDEGDMWTLAEADALNDVPALKTTIRLIRNDMKAARDSDDPKRAAKDIFNRYQQD
jgi:HK97 family phage portal protein